jgi:uncharacterized OB-fold protein
MLAKAENNRNTDPYGQNYRTIGPRCRRCGGPYVGYGHACPHCQAPREQAAPNLFPLKAAA